MVSFTNAYVSVLALCSLASATITISPPNFKTNSENVITWTSSDPDTDPTSFSIELINPSFNTQFAVANNVPTTQGSITFQLPTIIVNGDGYQIQFVNPGNINQVIASSNTFSIQPNNVGTSAANTLPSSSGTGTGTSSTVTSTSTSVSTTSSVSTLTQSSSLASSTAPSSSASTSGSTVATISSSASVSSSSSSSASASSASTFNNNSAASGLAPSGSVAAFIAGILALLF